MSGSNQFEPVRVSIFIMMNRTEPEQAVQSGSVQSGSVHRFAVRFAGSEPNHANTTVLRLSGLVLLAMAWYSCSGMLVMYFILTLFFSICPSSASTLTLAPAHPPLWEFF